MRSRVLTLATLGRRGGPHAPAARSLVRRRLRIGQSAVSEQSRPVSSVFANSHAASQSVTRKADAVRTLFVDVHAHMHAHMRMYERILFVVLACGCAR